MAQEEKFVYVFEEGRADMKYVLGGKGANLAEITRLVLPLPRRRLVQIFGNVAMRIEGQAFEDAIEAIFASSTISRRKTTVASIKSPFRWAPP